MSALQASFQALFTWTSGPPSLRLERLTVFGAGLTAARYEVFLHERAIGYVIRSGGSYVGQPITINPMQTPLSPRQELILRVGGADESHALHIDLWDDADVTVFNNQGRRLVDVANLDLEKGYLLVLRGDLSFEPPHLSCARAPNREWTFLRLDAGRTEETRVRLESGEPVWESAETSERPFPSLWGSQAQTDLTEGVKMTLKVEPPWKLVSVRHGQDAFEASAYGHSVTVGPLHLPIDRHVASATVNATLEVEGSRRVGTYRFPARRIGIAVCDADGAWRAYGPRDALDLGATAITRVLLEFPKGIAVDLLEGSKVIGAFSSPGVYAAPSFVGLGAALSLRALGGESWILLRSVVNTGIVEATTFVEDSITFTLRRSLDRAPQALILHHTGKVSTARCERTGDREWRATAPPTARPLAAALQADAWLGVGWREGWLQAASEDWLAPMIRNMKLPVLAGFQSAHRASFRRAFSAMEEALALPRLDPDVVVDLEGMDPDPNSRTAAWKVVDDGIEAVDRTQSIDIAELERSRYRMTGLRGSLVLFEGERTVRAGESRIAPLRGLGEELSVRSTATGRSTTLAASVVDAGILSRASVAQRHGHTELTGGRLDTISDREVDVIGFDRRGVFWRRAVAFGTASFRFDVEQPLAFGLAHKGERLGAFWDDSWFSPFEAEEPLPRNADVMMAALARWMRLPVASAPERFLAIAMNNPHALVRAYLEPTEVVAKGETEDFSLLVLPAEALELELFRSLVPSWENGNSESFELLIDAWSENLGAQPPALAACRALARFDPRLAACALRGWLEALSKPKARTIAEKIALACGEASTLKKIGQHPYTGPLAEAAKVDELGKGLAAYEHLIEKRTVPSSALASPHQRAVLLTLLLRDLAVSL